MSLPLLLQVTLIFGADFGRTVVRTINTGAGRLDIGYENLSQEKWMEPSPFKKRKMTCCQTPYLILRHLDEQKPPLRKNPLLG